MKKLFRMIFPALLLLAIATEVYFLPEMFGKVGDNAQRAYDESPNTALGGMVYVFYWFLFIVLLPVLNFLVAFVIYMQITTAMQSIDDSPESFT